MENKGLVTIICIAFNHEKWIEKALRSVQLQTYEDKELLIVDNASSDHSAGIIREWVESQDGEFPVSAIYKNESLSYCQLFNELLTQANGEYVVDLSGDDFLYPQHLSFSVGRLKEEPEAVFSFSDATISDEDGFQNNFYIGKEMSGLRDKLLGRDFYQKLIRRSFICAPTVIFKTKILKIEGGYDETLSYEDFDIQLRLTSKYQVVFSDHIGVLKRKHSQSLSAKQYQSYNSTMLPSTLKVCQKIREMNSSEKEDEALGERILFELKHALWSANFPVAEGFAKMADEMRVKTMEFRLYRLWLILRVDLTWLYAKLT